MILFCFYIFLLCKYKTTFLKMERVKKILTLCIALATLIFYCANGGENAPFGVQCLTVAGIVAAIMVAVSRTPQSNSVS